MAKKKKEQCPYCGKMFTYLNRHKCKIKARVEGEEDEKSNAERRVERIEEKKKTVKRSLKKDEKDILTTIREKDGVFFEDLLKKTSKKRNQLEVIIDVLALKGKIKIRRELVNASWTKQLFAIKNYEGDVDVKDAKINKEKTDFIWDMFSRVPCFKCPFTSKCSETSQDQFNPKWCPWLTDWIEKSLDNQKYEINFDDIEQEIVES